MKGIILNYSIQSNSGIITCDDGNRYSFVSSEWKEEGFPEKGLVVDFAIGADNGTAKDIFKALESNSIKNGAKDSNSELNSGYVTPDGMLKRSRAPFLLCFLFGMTGVYHFAIGENKRGMMKLFLFFASNLLLCTSQIMRKDMYDENDVFYLCTIYGAAAIVYLALNSIFHLVMMLMEKYKVKKDSFF
jgi:hypothetical protein